MAEDNPLIDGTIAFAALPPETREKIIKAFERVSPAQSTDELARVVAKEINEDSTQDSLAKLVTGLAPIVAMVASSPGSDFAERIAPILASASKASDTQQISAELRRLLACERSIGITGKAQQVLWGHGRVYVSSHAISQIRPIFFADLEKPAEHAVIVHDLRIGYREDTFNSAFEITLDENGIRDLISVLTHAIKKNAAMQQIDAFKCLLPYTE